MTLSETIKNELQAHCKRIVSLLGIKHGSVEVRCFKGEPTHIDVHDKSINFESKLKTK